MCETRQTVEKISHSRWLLNAEKYFTEVTQSVSDARMIPLNWKGNCSSYSKSTNAVKMLFTRTVPCMKLLLSASFNHSKITQMISTIFLPNVSFNCQHRKELDSLYSGGILSPVRLTFSRYVYQWKCEDAIKLDSLVIKSFRQILLQWRTRQSITSSSSSTCGSPLEFGGSVAWLVTPILGGHCCHLVEGSQGALYPFLFQIRNRKVGIL